MNIFGAFPFKARLSVTKSESCNEYETRECTEGTGADVEIAVRSGPSGCENHSVNDLGGHAQLYWNDHRSDMDRTEGRT